MAVNGGDSFRIDIDRLMSSIEDMMSYDLVMSSKCCISKTPLILKRHNEKAFNPDAFSIGPLHHGDQNLKATEKIKAKYLQGLIRRSHNPGSMLRTLISSVMEVEKEARECYAEAIPYNPEQLVQILVIDGCFLIELFLKYAIYELREVDDPIFTRSSMLSFLLHDLILLENQIPWMVLEILFKWIPHNSFDNKLILFAMNFFRSILFTTRSPTQDQVNNIQDIKHFVDLFRKICTLSSTDPQPDQCINIGCIKQLSTLSSTLFRKLSIISSILFEKLPTLSSTKEKKERRRGWEILPPATSLVEFGIKFKRGTSITILDVKFNDGILEIPPFQIDDITETVFRNLISYEQCLTHYDDRIASYAILLDSLIDTAKDIDILCDNQIIDNRLKPEDAAQLFNTLYHDTGVIAYYYTGLSRQVNSFCQRQSPVNRFCHRHWPRWRTVLVSNYLSTPWSVLSTLAAVILLILTFLQTLALFVKAF